MYHGLKIKAICVGMYIIMPHNRHICRLRRRNDRRWHMLIKDIQNGKYFRAIDNTILCELLHPAKEDEALEIRCSIAHAIVKPGVTTVQHRLKTSAEVYYILDGEGVIYIDDESADVHSGQAIYIPPNSKQNIQNTGNYNLKILCIVYPMWRMEDEEVL